MTVVSRRSRSALAAALLVACDGTATDDRRRTATQSAPMTAATLVALTTEGDSMYWRGAYDSARVVWHRALEQAVALRDTLEEPRILMWLGLAAMRQGDFSDARTFGERSLALKLARGLTTEVARSYNALGLLAQADGRLSDAADLFEKSRQAAEAHGDQAGIARAAGNLGLVYSAFADFDRARHSYGLMRDIAAQLNDARMEGNALANLATLDIATGDPRSALGALTKARRLYTTIAYATGEGNALGQLGTLYATMGEPTRAFAALDSALGLARQQGMRQEEAILLELIGNVYTSVGDPQRALRFYEDALSIASEVGLDAQVATIRRSEGAVHARLGNLRLARRSAEAALIAHRKSGARLDELDDVLLIAEIASLGGDTSEAEARAEEAARVAAIVGTPSAAVLVALARARIDDRARRHARVIVSLRSVSSTAPGVDAATRWEVEALRARAYARLGQYDSATAIGRRAVAEVERIRDAVQPGPLRTSYVADRAVAYTDLVMSLLRLGRTQEAFEVAGAARGRALVEHLATARQNASGALHDLVDAERLLRQIDELLSRMREMEKEPDGLRGEGAASRRDLTQRIATARTEYETLLLRIAREHPAASALFAVRRVPTAEILRSLRPDELLVQYLVTPDRVVIFAATTAGVDALTSEISATELTHQVRLARDLLSQRDVDSTAVMTVSTSLFTRLIEPLRTAGLLDRGRRLIIVPYDALSYLPFAALRDRATGRALSDDRALVLLPSPGALPILRSGTASSGSVVRAEGSIVFAPFPQRLPATDREAREVLRVVPRSTAHVGARATETALRRALEGPRPVHVATHGVMNARNPMFSRIELARDTASEAGDDDGRLEVHEILHVAVRSPLVFLSGCETGVGAAWSTDFARGEDYATLAQAFLFAGARDVIATLWRIDDAGAAAFAELFYRHLQSRPPAEALAATQHEMQRHPRFSLPYYWAGYTLSGGGSVPPPIS